jgi:hypothetical protein
MTIAATVSITQDDLFNALGNFITSLGFLNPAQVDAQIPIDVIRLPVNRNAIPVGGFISMTPSAQVRLSTNKTVYPPNSSGPGGVVVPTDFASTMNTRVDVQLDCYGPPSGDWAQILCNLLRSAYACDWFAANVGFDITPLYADDPHQMPLVDGEQQYEERWTMNCALQSNPTVTLPQQYARVVGPVKITDVL